MLTQERVRELFDYDPETGDLIRRHATKGYDAGRRISRRNDRGYLVTTVETKTYRVHHLVWLWHTGELPREVDHINRVKHDNRIENLRTCDHRPNCGNSSERRPGYKGVSYCKATGRWKAQIGVNYKNRHLGRYDTPEEAALAYNDAAVEEFGEFAYLNKVSS